MADFGTITQPGAFQLPLSGSAPQGAIQGGLLRPGSIDQSQFQHMLMAQQLAREAAAGSGAGTGMTLNDYRNLAGAPLAPAPAPAVPDGIPNLTAEQFAVLTGMAEGNTAPPADLGAPAAGVTTAKMPAEMPGEMPAEMPGAANIAAAAPDSEPAVDTAHPNGSVPDARESADPRVVWVDSVPDRDERHALQASGKRWRLKETPGANELFLGPDGKFGWDDFVDIINPLQHIPIVSQIYRAVTGDQAYGLPQFIVAAPLGPLSIANAVINTVIRAQTGRDAGTDLAAAILGIDNRTPEAANLHLVTPSDQLAAAPSSAPVSTERASATSDAWTRDGGRA